MVQQALQVAVAIQDGWSRARILRVLATQVQHLELQTACVEAALALSDDRKERITISAIVTRQNPALLTYELWRNWLTHTGLNRAELLGVMDDLTRCAIQLTGRTEEAEEIAEAIIDVCQWWH